MLPSVQYSGLSGSERGLRLRVWGHGLDQFKGLYWLKTGFTGSAYM